MKKLKNRFLKWTCLKLLGFAIYVYELKPYGLLDDEDKAHLKQVWELYENIKKRAV